MSQFWPSFWLQAYRSLQVLLMVPSLSLMLLGAALVLGLSLVRQRPFTSPDWRNYYWLALTQLFFFPAVVSVFRIWTGPSGAIQAKHDRELGPRDLVLACSGFGGFLDLPDERTQVVCVWLDRPATRPFARRFLRRCNVDNRSHIVVASERHPGRPSMVATPQSSHLWPCRCRLSLTSHA